MSKETRKCYICGKRLEGSNCPICQKGGYAISVGGKPLEDVLLERKKEIDKDREIFLKKLEIYLIVVYSKDMGDRWQLERKEEILIGSGYELYEHDWCWCERKMARPQNNEPINVSIRIKGDMIDEKLVVSVPYISEVGQFQEVGMHIKDDCKIVVAIRNFYNKNFVQSKETPMFE